MSWAALMDQVVSVSRGSPATKDAGGGSVRTFATIASNVPAAIQSASANEQDIFSRRNIVVDTIVYSTYDFDSKISGGLKLGDNIIDANSITYVVKGVAKNLNQVISPLPLYKITCQRLIS